jgi:PAS domain S-box-containing protein
MRRQRYLCAVVAVWLLWLSDAVGAEPSRLRVVGDNNYPPYLFLDQEGRATGYLVDIWRLWEQKTGVTVTLEARNWAEAQQQLLAGEADVIENTFRTPEREPLYDFTAPYATLPVAIYRHASISGIHDVQTLHGFRVGVMAGDACIERLHAEGITDLQLYPTYVALIRGARAEEIKIFCLDEYPANYYLYQLGAHQRFEPAFQLYEGRFHRAVREGDTATLRLVERGMAAISVAEESAIHHKWMHRPVDYGPLVRSLGLATLLLLVLGLVLLAWTQLLRRRVRARTEALSQALAEVQQARRESEAARARLEVEVAERTAALAAAVDEQRVIFDTATSGIALIKDRVLLRCNRRLHEIFGWPQGSMMGQRTRIWYPDEAADAAGGAPVYARIWAGEPHCREQQLIRHDGSLFWARLSGNAIDARDPGKGTVWVIDDISAEHAAVEQMREARALAEEAARSKSDFLANMSHEIRTPMNSIIGMTHLMLQTEPTARQQGYLSEILQASEHLMGIINEILDFSAIEAGKLKVLRGDFVLRRVLEDVAALISGPCAAKRLELSILIDPAVPERLIGDPVRLRQILSSYAKNAFKFTERGQISIEASLVSRDARGVELLLAVRDTGIGIEETQRQRLFETFRQADGSISRKFGGTGLGLALARRLAELMDGEVGVDSTPGVGSCFWLKLRFGLVTGERGGEQDRQAAVAIARRGEDQTMALGGVTRTEPAQGSARPAANRSTLSDILCCLSSQLANDDFAASRFIETHQALLSSTLGEHYAPIVAAIQGYDFAAAAHLLAQTIAKLGLECADDAAAPAAISGMEASHPP